VNIPSAKEVRRQCREHTERLNAKRQANKSRRPRGPRGTRRTEADNAKSQTQNKARSILVDVASSNSDNSSASRIVANEPSPAKAQGIHSSARLCNPANREDEVDWSDGPLETEVTPIQSHSRSLSLKTGVSAPVEISTFDGIEEPGERAVRSLRSCINFSNGSNRNAGF
jgi:hypothetical protein